MLTFAFFQTHQNIVYVKSKFHYNDLFLKHYFWNTNNDSLLFEHLNFTKFDLQLYQSHFQLQPWHK